MTLLHLRSPIDIYVVYEPTELCVDDKISSSLKATVQCLWQTIARSAPSLSDNMLASVIAI